MTRDEAIAKVKKSNVGWWYPEGLIDFLSELDVLKLDEPKNADEIAREVIEREVAEWNMVRSGSVKANDVSTSLLSAFDRAGIKIFEK